MKMTTTDDYYDAWKNDVEVWQAFTKEAQNDSGQQYTCH